jgi:hypothetical protein
VLGYQLVFNDGYVSPSIVCDCHEKDITFNWQQLFFLMSKTVKRNLHEPPQNLKSDEISDPHKKNSKRFVGFLKPRAYNIISPIIS